MGADQSSTREKAATAKDVQKALDQQRRLYEHRIASLIQENERKNATASMPPEPVVSLERERSPYSYTHNTLQNQACSAASTNTNIYPNLNAASSSAYNPFADYQSDPHQFVYVNNFVQHPQVSQSPQKFQPTPTAPPIEPSNLTSNTHARSRSRSQQRGGPDDDIKCKTCGNYFGDKIFQCNRGHSSCASCKTRQVPCGQCSEIITTRRNYDLEKYVVERKVPCPNAADGCRLHVKIAEVETHTKECPFKVLECPSLGRCSWRGKLPQLLEHFDALHSIHRQGNIDKEMFIANIYNSSHTLHFIQIGSFHFLFHVKISHPVIYMAAQLIGTKHSAAKWNYEIHIYNKKEPRRKFQYFNHCSSFSESISDIFDSSNCAVILCDYARTYICAGTVAYKFYIKQDEAKPREGNKKWNGPRRNANKINNK